MERIDPHTNEKFIPKRRNQRFKNSRNRIAFNNEVAAKLRSVTKNINSILKRNYLIATNLVAKGKEKAVPKSELIALGFNVNVFTHYEQVGGHICRCLYHIKFPITENKNEILIINPN